MSGDFQVDFNFPDFKSSEWLQNPCIANTISVTPNILETRCPRFSEGNDGFTIEAISTKTINSKGFKPTFRKQSFEFLLSLGIYRSYGSLAKRYQEPY